MAQATNPLDWVSPSSMEARRHRHKRTCDQASEKFLGVYEWCAPAVRWFIDQGMAYIVGGSLVRAYYDIPANGADIDVAVPEHLRKTIVAELLSTGFRLVHGESDTVGIPGVVKVAALRFKGQKYDVVTLRTTYPTRAGFHHATQKYLDGMDAAVFGCGFGNRPDNDFALHAIMSMPTSQALAQRDLTWKPDQRTSPERKAKWEMLLRGFSG